MLSKFFEKIGERVLNFLSELGEVTMLLIDSVKSLRYLPKSKRIVLYQMEHIGVGSLPLVLIIAIFTGAVAAWQAAYQLKGVAPMSLLGGTTSRAIITELGPVLTGIVIAGRVGASIAAELGTMKVTEQIDALEIMAIQPVRFLAMPRIVASVFMMPVLVVLANAISVFGAYLVSRYFIGISFAVFFTSVKKFFIFSDFTAGLFKTVVFGGVTALLGCHIGFHTSGGAEGVGQATIRSFVMSAAMILILDYFLWMLIF
ncbi:ABC transporter permease [bacterium BMS3Abin03]|nr:ABC transporter permease [bacterium BMS3Abin03]MCG6959845.1 ABC transporter permease [bacterium BMS3Abin03]